MATAMPHDHDRCIQDALDAAARVCAANGVQLTKLRRRVLELVWSGHKAVKAYELLDQLGSASRPAKPPTVYRALEFLMQQGLVHRVDSLNAFIGCPQPDRRHQGQFLICSACGGVDEIDEPGIRRAIARGAADAGFSVEQQTVELHGVCAGCRGQ